MLLIIEQRLLTWGTFAYPKGYIVMLAIEEKCVFIYLLFPNIYTCISEYYFQKPLYAYF